MSRDGDIQRLTFLTTKYIASEQNYVWSPNGGLIAFWLTVDNRTPQLAILDLSTGEVTNLCISGGDYGVSSPASPIWSSDGKNLVVSIPNKNKLSDIVLVDLKNFIAIKIGENVEAMGWLVNKP
jgi:Tol biopolymer transport system component